MRLANLAGRAALTIDGLFGEVVLACSGLEVNVPSAAVFLPVP